MVSPIRNVSILQSMSLNANKNLDLPQKMQNTKNFITYIQGMIEDY